MKAAVRFIASAFFTFAFQASSLFAYNVPDGWYFGFTGTVSKLSKFRFGLPFRNLLDQRLVPDVNAILAEYEIDINDINRVFIPGRIQYGMGGGFSAQGGYRFCGVRLEGEFKLNYNPYQQLYLNDVLFKRRPQVTNFPEAGPVVTFPFTMGGATVLVGGLANLYYDLYLTDDAEWIPYAGAGIGYAFINNQFTINYIPLTRPRVPNRVPAGPNSSFITLFKYNENTTVPIAQLIAGLSYQLDDFFSAGLDYRYLASASVDKFTNKRLTLQSINLTFNHWFN